MNPTNEQELREQINAIREELVGRNQTHQKVAKLSNWTRIEFENVIKQDGWIYENEMIALITAHTNAEIARTLDRLESTAVYAEYDKAEDDVICGDVVPLDAIQAERALIEKRMM